MQIPMTNGQWAQRYNQCACHYMQFSGVCKITGKSCEWWDKSEECDSYLYHADAVKRSSLDKNLRMLSDEAAGNMLFIENDDDRFTKEELEAMMDCVVLKNPELTKYIEIDLSGEGDYKIAIYEGIGSILV